MSEQVTNATANSPAANGAITKDEVTKLIQDTISKSLSDTLKPLTERLADAEKNLKTVADTVANQKILGEDKVKELVAAESQNRVAQAQKEAEAKQASEAIKAKREAFATQHLKNVPARYHAELGDDEKKWDENAKAIRTSFADDLKASGVKVADVGGSAGGDAIEGAKKDGGFLKMPGTAAPAAAATAKA